MPPFVVYRVFYLYECPPLAVPAILLVLVLPAWEALVSQQRGTTRGLRVMSFVVHKSAFPFATLGTLVHKDTQPLLQVLGLLLNAAGLCRGRGRKRGWNGLVRLVVRLVEGLEGLAVWLVILLGVEVLGTGAGTADRNFGPSLNEDHRVAWDTNRASQNVKDARCPNQNTWTSLGTTCATWQT